LDIKIPTGTERGLWHFCVYVK